VNPVTVNDLDKLYSDHGKLAAMYRRVLAGYGKALSLDHTSILGTLNNMGIDINKGKLAEG
jgi:hypothetical protein